MAASSPAPLISATCVASVDAFKLNGLPLRGYASHGEGWSAALALRLGCYDLLSADGAEPVLILDDVFADLDLTRRDRLATLASKAEQVLISAAVVDDVPSQLAGARYEPDADDGLFSATDDRRRAGSNSSHFYVSFARAYCATCLIS